MSSSRRGLFRSAAQAAARAAIPDLPPDLPNDELTDEERTRYARQLALWTETHQRRLRDASVLVVGAGAVGTTVAAELVEAGIGRLGLADEAAVALDGLSALQLTPDIGQPKVHAAVAKLQLLNPEVMVEPYQVHLDADNAEGLVLGNDLVVDCSGHVETHYAVNAACCVSGPWLVVADAAGMVMSIRPGSSPCYRCAFPDPVAPVVRTRAAAAIGALAALEAIKLIAGLGGAVTDGRLQVDLETYAFERVPVARRTDCPDCG